MNAILKNSQLVFCLLQIFIYTHATLAIADDAMQGKNLDKSFSQTIATCDKYTEKAVAQNVIFFIRVLFSKNEPSIGDALKFFGGEAASEDFLQRENYLGSYSCLHKWKLKNWSELSETQKSQCGDFTDSNNKSLYYKKIRSQIGLINRYVIDKITHKSNENGWSYFKVKVTFYKLHSSKQSFMELIHRGDNCKDEGGWMQIVTINGKIVK